MVNNNEKMPKDTFVKCSIAIHSASLLAGGFAVIPIPMADRVPITAAQVGMVIALGKVFDITISNSVAKAVVGCSLAQSVGLGVSDAVLKSIPLVNVFIAPTVCSITATGLSEALGWVIAEDFYRMSIGKEPENIIDNAGKIKKLFKKPVKVKRTNTVSSSKK